MFFFVCFFLFFSLFLRSAVFSRHQDQHEAILLVPSPLHLVPNSPQRGTRRARPSKTKKKQKKAKKANKIARAKELYLSTWTS
jgi:hypothetical protein